MTNREWLNTLSDEDFATWATQEDSWDFEKHRYVEPSPTLRTIVARYSCARVGLLKWLGEQRSEQK